MHFSFLSRPNRDTTVRRVRLGGGALESIVVAGVAMWIGATVLVAVPAASAVAPTLAVPTSGALFGAFANPSVDGYQTPSTFTALEATAGRQLDVDRVYANWDTPEPTSQLVWDVANGVVPLLSIGPLTASGSVVPWAQIASGSDDAAIVAQAKGLASLGAPVLLGFDHEANLHTGDGTPADYVAAWRHYVTVVRQYAPNVSFVLILSQFAYDQNYINSWYPGDSYVDWVGADGYNHDFCGSSTSGWQSFRSIFSAFNSFAVAHKRPAVVAEWASVEDPNVPGRKAAWITEAGQTMERWPQIKAASYFDSYGTLPTCDWPLTSSASATQAFAALGAQSYFHPRPTVSLSPSTAAGPAPLAVEFSTTGTAGTIHPITSWVLNFGDGTNTSGPGPPPTTVTHTYAASDDTATLSVTDSVGETNFANVSVLCAPPAMTWQWGQFTSTTTAEVHAGIDPNQLETRYHFAWGTTRGLDNASATLDLGAGADVVHVLKNLSGLIPGTTYYWDVRATNAAGTSTSPLMSFETSGGAPRVSSVTATIGTPTSATLAGAVDPHAVDTKWHFEYGPTTSYGTVSPVTPGDAGSGSAMTAVSTQVSGLSVATSYHYALVAVNAAGTTVTPDHVFRTPKPPALGAHSVTKTATTAQLFVWVFPHGLATTYRFQWGTSPSLGQATSWMSAGAGTAEKETTVLTGLQPRTTYYWDVTATNAAGSVTGTMATFTTK
jgi:hypothetical protein